MATCCCLCRCDLSSSQAKKRRKRLYGEACNVARTVLATEVEVMFGVGLDEIQETEQTQCSSPPIFVCKSCQTKLQNIADKQNQVVQQKHELRSYLTSLHPLSWEEPSTSSVGQKRSIHSTSSNIPFKRLCLESTAWGGQISTSADQSGAKTSQVFLLV